MTGNPHSKDIFSNDHKKAKRKFEKNLVDFMQSRRTKEALDEYNFEPEKLRDMIVRNHRLGIYNIIFILNRGRILWDCLNIYTKAHNDWTEEDKFVEVHNFLNQYNIYR